jgi:hypothetical protein
VRRKFLGALVGVAFAAFSPTAAADVVINEVDCDATDWVELLNTGAGDEDISGWRLTDAPIGSGAPLVFPSGTQIPAGGRLVFERNQPGGFTFGISCADRVRLANATPTVVDEVQLPNMDFDLDTWGRIPDGSGAWRQTFPTKGAPNSPSPSGVDEAAALFDPGQVAEIDIQLPPASIAALSDPATWEDYQDGTIEVRLANGVAYGPLAVGVRLKGGMGSFRPLTEKAAFKVRFPHTTPGARLLGLKTLTLNNMVQDPSMLHELLAYRLFREAGVPAPRTGYAFVEVNDADYGLYLNVETVDDVSLPVSGLSSTQHLYEGEHGADVTPERVAELKSAVDEGSESDFSDLDALQAAVNDPLAPDWSDHVAPYADLAEMTRFWAVEKYVGHWDGYSGRPDPNNYFLHSDASGSFRLLPWGTDQTWHLRIPFDAPGGRLFERCVGDSSCAAQFRQAVEEIRNTAATLPLDVLAANTAALLAPWQLRDPRREYATCEIDSAVAAVRSFIALRPAEADAWLAGNPVAPGASTPGPCASSAGGSPTRAEPPSTKLKRKQIRRSGRNRVVVAFRSNPPGADFQCRRNRRPWESCESPEAVSLAGLRRFLIRAVGEDGIVDPIPIRLERRSLRKLAR